MPDIAKWLKNEERKVDVDRNAQRTLQRTMFASRPRPLFLGLAGASLAVCAIVVTTLFAPHQLTAENVLANAIDNMSNATGDNLSVVRKTTTTNAGTTVEEVITDGTRYLVTYTDENGTSFMPDWYEKNNDDRTLTRYAYNQGVLERHLEGDYAHRYDRPPESGIRTWIPTPDRALIGITPDQAHVTWRNCTDDGCDNPISISSGMLRNADSMNMTESEKDGRTVLTIVTDLKEPDIIITHVIDRNENKLIEMKTESKKHGVQMTAQFTYETIARDQLAIDFTFEGWIRAVAADLSDTKVMCFAYMFSCTAETSPSLYFPAGWREDERFTQ